MFQKSAILSGRSCIARTELYCQNSGMMSSGQFYFVRTVLCCKDSAMLSRQCYVVRTELNCQDSALFIPCSKGSAIVMEVL